MTTSLSSLDLVTAIREHRVSSYRMEPGLSNRASELGHPCLRYLVYSRVAWHKAEPPSDDSISIFAEGDMHEAALLRELSAAGIDVREQQAPLYYDKFNISGHVDAVVVYGDGNTAILEIKTMHPYIWRSIFGENGGQFHWSEVESGFQTRSWLKRYYPQTQIYIALRTAAHGLLLCKDKGSGKLAQVFVPFDKDEVARLFKRAASVNQHVKEGTLPGHTLFPDRDCPGCAFLHHCNPTLGEKSPLTLCSDKAVEGWLDERKKLQQASKSYKEVDGKVKEWMKSQEKEEFQVGSYVLKKFTGKNGTRVTVKEVKS